MAGFTREQQIVLNKSKQVLHGEEQPDFSGAFCKGFTERCIEPLWAAAHLRGGRSLLDIGFTFEGLGGFQVYCG